jgi:protein-tyrosine phosphatase
MQGSLDRPPIVVRSSRWTALWLLIAGGAFVAVGVGMVGHPRAGHPSDPAFGYFSIVFFGLGVVFFAARLLRPDELELGPAGLIWRNFVRTRSWRWRDVWNFRPYRPTARVRSAHIGFDFADDYEPQNRGGREITRRLTGVEGSVGGGWELRAADLADLLNTARARWIGSNPEGGSMSPARMQRYCGGRHPALAVGGGHVIYGGSCVAPLIADADLYVGLDRGMSTREDVEQILFPIADGDPPNDPDAFRALVADVSARLDRGDKVHVGCLAGHGRTGTFLAALVAHRGASDDPIAYVRENYCVRAVETGQQVAFLTRHFACKAHPGSYEFAS